MGWAQTSAQLKCVWAEQNYPVRTPRPILWCKGPKKLAAQHAVARKKCQGGGGGGGLALYITLLQGHFYLLLLFSASCIR